MPLAGLPGSVTCACSSILAGTFTLTCTTDDSPVVTQAGNAVTGQFTLTKIGDEDHWVSQYNDDGAGNTYTLTGGGDRSYTLSETLNDVTGGNSPSEIGSTDAYSLTQTGNIGAKVYTQTLQATETYNHGGSENTGRKEEKGPLFENRPAGGTGER